MTLALVTPPAVEPLTATQVRTRLGLGAEIADATITAWITAERQRLDGADGALNRALITQTWDYVLDGFPTWSARPAGEARRPYGGYGDSGFVYEQAIYLPLPPLQSVTSITYLDGNGVTQTVDPTTYRVIRGEPARIVPSAGNAWPSTGYTSGYPGVYEFGDVTVRFVCGYGSSGANVPEAILSAIVLRVAMHNGLSSQNPMVQSETVFGVSSTTYGTAAGAMAIEAQVNSLLRNYMGAGIS